MYLHISTTARVSMQKELLFICLHIYSFFVLINAKENYRNNTIIILFAGRFTRRYMVQEKIEKAPVITDNSNVIFVWPQTASVRW